MQLAKVRASKGITRSKNSFQLALAAAAVVGALGLGAERVHATEYHWVSSTSGNWDTATSWNPNGVPDGGAPFDSGVIDNVGADVTIYLNSLDRTIAGMTFNNTGATNVVGGAVGAQPQFVSEKR